MSEQQAIKETVADFIQWTLAQQKKWAKVPHRIPMPPGFEPWQMFQHPGAESPRINPDYEWLHRKSWCNE